MSQRVRPTLRPGAAAMRALVSAVALAAALAVVLPPGGALAATDRAASTIVLTLRPASAQALDVTRAPAGPAERAHRTQAARPTPQAQERVRGWLGRHGFRVLGVTSWTVTASGPAPRLAGRLPAELRRDVLAATGQRRAGMRSHAVPGGYAPGTVRQVYGVQGDGEGATVATIQFSGWRAQDAEVFARAAGIALLPGQLTTTSVLGADPTQRDGRGGDFEVALDVEAILGQAPAARQRVFVGPNTEAGAAAVYDAVATAAERDGLTAVSISWGSCEPDTSASLLASLEQSLRRMLAAGATVTAASGDAGAYGCALDGTSGVEQDGSLDSDLRLAVDYPASSPAVLAVGGTTLQRVGAGWLERAWSDGVVSGSGGGLSGRFPRPAWQVGAVAADRRAVPDLAMVGDPATGLGVYAPEDSGRSSWQAAGGTSAAAPLLAGQLAAAASAAGRSRGFGRIAVPLYAGTGVRDIVDGGGRHRAGPGFDLVSGLGVPDWTVLGRLLTEPSVLAPMATADAVVAVTGYAPGSDRARYGVAETAGVACAQATATRLPETIRLADGPDRRTHVVLAVQDGEVCRTVDRPLLVDRTAPTATAGLTATSRPGVLALTWGGADPEPSAGLDRVAWRLVQAGTGELVDSGASAGAGSRLLRAPAGARYLLQVQAVDALGRLSATATSAVVPA